MSSGPPTHSVTLSPVSSKCTPPGILPWRGKKVQFPYHLDINQEKINVSICFEDKSSIIYTINYISFCKEFNN